MTLRDALLSVREKHHHHLTPQVVVDEARLAEDEAGLLLHGQFDWNDPTAAESWRRFQARKLMASQRVVYREATEDSPEKSVRAFLPVPREGTYVWDPTEEVRENPISTELVLADMRRRWTELLREFEDHEEFFAMVKADLLALAA